jgi:hypothetical protein
MAEVEGEGNEDPNELLEEISRDEVTADAGDDKHRTCHPQIKEPEVHHMQKKHHGMPTPRAAQP